MSSSSSGPWPDGRSAEAVGLYAGDLLEGRYDDWLAAERERLAGLHADALQRLARQHEQEHRWPEAIRCAERLVARDPLREEYHRLLIGLCQASGTGPGRCAPTTCALPRWKTSSASSPRRKPGSSTSPSWPAGGPGPPEPAGSPAPRRWSGATTAGPAGRGLARGGVRASAARARHRRGRASARPGWSRSCACARGRGDRGGPRLSRRGPARLRGRDRVAPLRAGGRAGDPARSAPT